MANAPDDKKEEKVVEAKASAKKPAAKKAAAKKPAAKKTAAPKAKAVAKKPVEKAKAKSKPAVEKKATPKKQAPAIVAEVPRMKQVYHDDVVEVLKREFGYKNLMQVPKIEKIVLNIGLGEALDSNSAVGAATGDLQKITGDGRSYRVLNLQGRLGRLLQGRLVLLQAGGYQPGPD